MPVRERSKGVWQIDFRAGGRRIRRDVRCNGKKAAEAEERRLREAYDPRQITETLQGAFVQWRKDGCPKTYHTFIRQIVIELGNPRLSEIPAIVPSYITELQQRDLSSASINRRLAALRRVLNLAFKRWNWLDQPLGQKIELISEQESARHVYLTHSQVNDLAAACDEVCPFIWTLAYTGMRWRSEALRLTPDHVRDDAIYLGTDTKTKTPRTIPLHPNLAGLASLLPWGFSEKTIQRRWSDARYWVGLPHVRLHDLRHTFASWLAASDDTPWFVIRDLLGHTDSRTTSRYAHLRQSELRKAVTKLR